MKYKCVKCGTLNIVPPNGDVSNFVCQECKTPLPLVPAKAGETSAAVGMVGGAALGAAIAGPPGAIVGGIIGAILGKESKGVG